MSQERKYVVITGASSGIGAAAAKAFAARGKNLVLIARREDRLEQLQQQLRARYPDQDFLIRTCDLSVPANLPGLYESLASCQIETWINNAGFGNYESVADQNLTKTATMLRLNIEALTILSTLYVRDYKDTDGTQLINVSSGGGYTVVPGAVTYCASKYFVSAFTEGLAQELMAAGARLRAKVLAPAATKTEFGRIANDVSEYDYDQRFGTYHTDMQVADFLLALYDSSQTVGIVNRETFEFSLRSPVFEYAGSSAHNQE